MSFDLPSLSKSISARIEGRNAGIALIIAFCLFSLYLFVPTYERHPTLSVIFISITFIVVILLAAGLLLLTPRPSEVSEKAIVIHQDMFSAKGMQSHQELVDVLRELRGIRDLPGPVAIVKGTATNPSDYVTISPDESAKIAQADREGISKQLDDEAIRIARYTPQGTIASKPPAMMGKETDAGNV